MNTIGAFSPLTAKTFKNTAFKGNNPQNNASSPIQNNTASAQDALANMALADIEMAKKNQRPELYADKNGFMHSKKDGSLFSGTVVYKGEGTGKKSILEYEKGKLTKLEKYTPDDSENPEKIYEFSYPDENNLEIKHVNLLKYNSIPEEYTVWDRFTFTPEVYAQHHIGQNKYDDTTLVIKNRKTHKKMSEVWLLNKEVEKAPYLPKCVEENMPFLTQRFRPTKRLDYFEDGKTVRKKTMFGRDSLQRSEKTFDKNGNVESLIFFDCCDRPYEMNYYGITDNPVIINRKNPWEKKPKAEYTFSVKFFTNSGILPSSSASYDQEKIGRIISSGKVEEVSLSFEGPNGYSNYIGLHNLFCDEYGRVLDAQNPVTVDGIKPVSSAGTAIGDFLIASACISDGTVDLERFLERYEEGGIKLFTSMEIQDSKGRYLRCYIDPDTDNVHYYVLNENDFDSHTKEDVNNLYKKIESFIKRNELYPKRRTE